LVGGGWLIKGRRIGGGVGRWERGDDKRERGWSLKRKI